ncbi:SGNH/GDSL hydrolase family protein [Salinibacillus aidingensis]|uniref:SGNH/GDSL hydrolase family protein n=1 Tax=Salinibacillus aidingensis TaxID=237684 RepID=A0ABN1BKS3_9BACI
MEKLVCFGDSITARKEGYDTPMLTTKLAVQLEGFEVINAGASGNNTYDALSRIENDVIKYNPNLVTVMFGANDAAFHKMVDLETYKTNIYKITQMIKPKRTILITPAPVDEKVQFARTNEVLFDYALSVNHVAVETGCHFIDFFSKMIALDNYPQMLKGIRNDGLHFGAKGYDFLVGLLLEKIREVCY